MMRRHQQERGCGTSNVCYNIGVSLYLDQEVMNAMKRKVYN